MKNTYIDCVRSNFSKGAVFYPNMHLYFIKSEVQSNRIDYR